MGSTVQKIENDDFSDDNFAAALVRSIFFLILNHSNFNFNKNNISQLGYVKDEETNVEDWSKLDGIAAAISKSFFYTTSMFGTFDFDDLTEGTQASQKQRKTRRKAEPSVEKRPTAVSESGNASAGSAKVEAVFNTIKDVSIEILLNQSVLSIIFWQFYI